MNGRTAKLLNRAAAYAKLPGSRGLKREWKAGNVKERTLARRRLIRAIAAAKLKGAVKP